MNVLVIGAGGREHALANKLHQSPLIDQLHVIPAMMLWVMLQECILRLQSLIMSQS